MLVLCITHDDKVTLVSKSCEFCEFVAVFFIKTFHWHGDSTHAYFEYGQKFLLCILRKSVFKRKISFFFKFECNLKYSAVDMYWKSSRSDQFSRIWTNVISETYLGRAKLKSNYQKFLFHVVFLCWVNSAWLHKQPLKKK